MSAVPALPLSSPDVQPLPESRLRLLAELTQGLDAGALLYENLPLMGTAIRWLKGRLA